MTTAQKLARLAVSLRAATEAAEAAEANYTAVLAANHLTPATLSPYDLMFNAAVADASDKLAAATARVAEIKNYTAAVVAA